VVAIIEEEKKFLPVFLQEVRKVLLEKGYQEDAQRLHQVSQK